MTEEREHDDGQAEKESEQEEPPPPKQPVKDESVEATPGEFEVETKAVETGESAEEARQTIPNRDD